MVSESRQRLNQRLRQNWIQMIRTTDTMDDPSPATAPHHDDVIDSELTNLSWLVGLDLESPASDSSTGSGSVDGPGVKEVETKVDDWHSRPRKPTHTYSAMITMAINDTPDRRITVAGIYSWIRNNFTYYRHTSASWKNSVRHCLSTNKRFQRVSQSRDKFGKRFWRIVPDEFAVRKPENTSSCCRSQVTKRSNPNDGGIRQAIRVVARSETIDSTGDSHGSYSPTASIDDESIDGSSGCDPASPSDRLSPRWSSDSRLNEILNDLESIPTFGSDFEPCAFEQVAESGACQRLVSLENDFLISSDPTCNDDWILTDISRSSCGRSLTDFLQSAGQEEFHSDFLDSDLNLKAIISEF